MPIITCCITRRRVEAHGAFSDTDILILGYRAGGVPRNSGLSISPCLTSGLRNTSANYATLCTAAWHTPESAPGGRLRSDCHWQYCGNELIAEHPSNQISVGYCTSGHHVPPSRRSHAALGGGSVEVWRASGTASHVTPNASLLEGSSVFQRRRFPRTSGQWILARYFHLNYYCMIAEGACGVRDCHLTINFLHALPHVFWHHLC